jgi:hypothetical protein
MEKGMEIFLFYSGTKKWKDKKKYKFYIWRGERRS